MVPKATISHYEPVLGNGCSFSAEILRTYESQLGLNTPGIIALGPNRNPKFGDK